MLLSLLTVVLLCAVCYLIGRSQSKEDLERVLEYQEQETENAFRAGFQAARSAGQVRELSSAYVDSQREAGREGRQ